MAQALAKMAKQYLAAPFSSAGVERVFSAAGKMHDDLKKSATAGTLEMSLFAMQNIRTEVSAAQGWQVGSFLGFFRVSVSLRR